MIKLEIEGKLFSAGFEVFRGLIDHIYTPNSFVENPPADLVTIIKA